MIATDDPRHGTPPGYRAGCKDRCCLDAQALYERRSSKLRAMGRAGRVDPTGTRRRIQALQALGWTTAHIAEAGGFVSEAAVQKVVTDSTSWVFRTTVNRAARAYASLSMRPGPSRIGAARAARAGWPPPLAWDDDTIDDPTAEPYRPRPRRERNPELRQVDPVVVERALAGQPVHANQAERAEVLSRWIRTGRSRAELDRIQGWNVHRDRRSTAA